MRYKDHATVRTTQSVTKLRVSSQEAATLFVCFMVRLEVHICLPVSRRFSQSSTVDDVSQSWIYLFTSFGNCGINQGFIFLYLPCRRLLCTTFRLRHIKESGNKVRLYERHRVCRWNNNVLFCSLDDDRLPSWSLTGRRPHHLICSAISTSRLRPSRSSIILSHSWLFISALSRSLLTLYPILI